MPSDEKYLAIVDFNGKAQLTSGADPIRKEALAIASHVHKVTDEQELAQATDAFRVLGDIIKTVGDVRKTLTRPIDELKKEAIRLEETYLEPLSKEHGRIQGMINHFLIKQREREREAQEAQQRQLEDAQKSIEGAEQLKAKAADLRKRADDAEKAGMKDLAADLRKQADEAEELALTQELAAEDVSMAVAPVETMKVSGLSVREKVNFRVVDWQKFMTAFPRFFKWDKEKELLKLMRRDVLELINAEDDKRLKYDDKTKLPIVPGLEIYREVKGHAR